MKPGFKGSPTRGADPGTPHERLTRAHTHAMDPPGHDEDPDPANVGTPEQGSLPDRPQGIGPTIDTGAISNVPTTGEGPDIEE